MKDAGASGSCPQCGGPVKLDVGDPLLSCDFCKTKLYMIPPSGIFSYFLTPIRQPLPGAEICYLPYWRFRGFKFRIFKEKPLDCSLIDTTVPASELFSDLPLLGMAPQLGEMKLNTSSIPGTKFLNSPTEALKAADARIETFLKDRPVLEGITGENKSIILAPFEIIKDSENVSLRPLWGANGRTLLDKHHARAIESFSKAESQKDAIRFLPLICPECGADLPAFPRATALLCRFCNRVWSLGASRLFPKKFLVAQDSMQGDITFLPFWQFILKTQDMGIDDRYHFFRQLLPYRQTPEAWNGQPVQILIPAFKINPRLFFRLSTRMTRCCQELRIEKREVSRRISKIHMVNFTMEEAARAIRIVLFHMFHGKKRIKDKIKNASLKIKGSRIILLPFKKGRREYVEIHSGQAIPIAAIELGSRL